MMEQSTTSSVASTPRKTRAARRLDELLELGPGELLDLYRDAETPRLRDLDGDLRGRMLATPLAARGVVAHFLRALGASDRFPWRGKTFRHHGEARGEGHNRIFGKGFRLFRFETSIGPSRAGAFDALQLDYDLPDNPFFIRAIKDEVRTIAPGLFLGQAWLESVGKPRLCIYFGLESPSAVESTS
jgi:hypothetical protein